MNKYFEKAEHMIDHLHEHPTDYQTVISVLKMRDKGFMYQKKQRCDKKQKEIAEYRKKRKKDTYL